MNPRISIILLNFNGLKDTMECLESLKRITYPNYEVIIVDNGSKENDADVLEKEYSGYIKLIGNKENLGFAEGNNVAIREIMKAKKSEYILALNNDIVVEPDFLDELIKCVERHPEAGSIQPKMIWAVYPELIDAAGLEYSRNGFGFNRGGYEPVENYGEEKEIFGCCAGACLYRRKALEDIEVNGEYFDKDFFCNYEDFDLAFRLQWAGWKSWYCPKSMIYHKRGATGGIQSNFSIYHRRRNQVWTFFKNLSNSLILKNFPYFFIGEVLQLCLSKRRFISFKAKFDAYKNLQGILKKKKFMKRKVRSKEIEKWFTLRWRIKLPTHSYYNKNTKMK